ncbi:Sigma-70, region 4 [compost metagenome]
MYRVLREGLDEAPPQDIARQLGISVKQAYEAKIVAKLRLEPIQETNNEGDVSREPSTNDDLTEVHVNEFMSRLTDLQRDIVRLLMDGLTASEIARQLGITRQAVGQALQRIRAHYERFYPAA